MALQIEGVVQADHASTQNHQNSGNFLQHPSVRCLSNEHTLVNSQITAQNHVGTERNWRHLNLRRCLTRNLRQHYTSLINWVLVLLFTIFLCYYFYEVLIAEDPQVGKLNPNPSRTNFTVAVLAQVFGVLMVSLYLEVLNLLCLQLLSRPRRALMLEAVQLAKSTSALGTARMLFTPGRHHGWTVLRYVTSKNTKPQTSWLIFSPIQNNFANLSDRPWYCAKVFVSRPGR
jgi:uncharacterized membrane protein